MFCRQRTVKAVIGVFLFVAIQCRAAEMVPSAFIANDDWTFEQVLESPNKARHVNPPIRLSIHQLKETWIARMKAITDDHVPIWDLKAKLPGTICVIDFVGLSHLDLMDSCNRPLAPGMEWKHEKVSGETKTASTYRVDSTQDVTVKAGRFSTVKILRTEKKFSHRPPNPDRPAGEVKTTYWFSRDAKAFVLIVREHYTHAGALQLRAREELTSFQVGTPAQ